MGRKEVHETVSAITGVPEVHITDTETGKTAIGVGRTYKEARENAKAQEEY